MDGVEHSVKDILPGLDDISSLLEKLRQAGVQTVDDLPYVVIEDFGDLLTPIQRRKLIHAWKPGIPPTCVIK